MTTEVRPRGKRRAGISRPWPKPAAPATPRGPGTRPAASISALQHKVGQSHAGRCRYTHRPLWQRRQSRTVPLRARLPELVAGHIRRRSSCARIARRIGLSAQFRQGLRQPALGMRRLRRRNGPLCLGGVGCVDRHFIAGGGETPGAPPWREECPRRGTRSADELPRSTYCFFSWLLARPLELFAAWIDRSRRSAGQRGGRSARAKRRSDLAHAVVVVGLSTW